MPPAGSDPASRAKAHLQWAARYDRNGDNHKAISHVGSAIKYTKGARANSAHSSMFGALFPAKSDWRKVTVNGEIFELNRDNDNAPYNAMVAYETTPDDATLGASYLIRLPVTYNENSIYAYFVGPCVSYSIGGVLVATSAKTLPSLNATRLLLQNAIEDTNMATDGVFGPGPNDPAPAKALARLVLTKRVCDYGADHGILAMEPSPLRGYRDLAIDGLGVSLNGDFKKSFAREYRLGMRAGENVSGVHPGNQRLTDMREARRMTVEWNGEARSSGNIHFLQKAYTEDHRKKVDYFVASGDYQGEGKLCSLIFAPYTGPDARARVIRRIEGEVPTTLVSAGNLVNLLTIEQSANGQRLEPGAVFALRVFVWCTLVGCEFIDKSRDALCVSKQGDETHPAVFYVMWSRDADHTAIVSNNRNDTRTEFEFKDLGIDRGPARQKDHATAVAAITAALAALARANKTPKTG